MNNLSASTTLICAQSTHVAQIHRLIRTMYQLIIQQVSKLKCRCVNLIFINVYRLWNKGRLFLPGIFHLHCCWCNCLRRLPEVHRPTHCFAIFIGWLPVIWFICNAIQSGILFHFYLTLFSRNSFYVCSRRTQAVDTTALVAMVAVQQRFKQFISAVTVITPTALAVLSFSCKATNSVRV